MKSSNKCTIARFFHFSYLFKYSTNDRSLETVSYLFHGDWFFLEKSIRKSFDHHYVSNELNNLRKQMHDNPSPQYNPRLKDFCVISFNFEFHFHSTLMWNCLPGTKHWTSMLMSFKHCILIFCYYISGKMCSVFSLYDNNKQKTMPKDRNSSMKCDVCHWSLAPSSITESLSFFFFVQHFEIIMKLYFSFPLMLKTFHLVIVDDDAMKLPKSTLLSISKLSFRFFESEIHRWTYFWIRCEQQMEMRLSHDKIVPLPMFYHTRCSVPMGFSDSKCTARIAFHHNT